MEFEPKHLHIAYGDFSQLVGKANSKGVSIAETAKPLLFGAVGYCTAGAAKDELQIKVRDSAQQAWTDLLDGKQGQIILQEDIWEWIRRWFPDPIQGEQVPIVIDRWMQKWNL